MSINAARKSPPPPPVKRHRKAPPPPPMKRRKSPPPPPLRDVSRSKKKIRATIPEVIATAHVRRVTLNLIRHAACCPEDLRVVLNKLSDQLDWDMDALTRRDTEMIYAKVDKALADEAKDEFEADTSTIKDLVRMKVPEDEQHCKLCGHEHIRWEFDLRNLKGGLTAKTGSVCIEMYGLRVDGEMTQEAALAKLRAAISNAKRKAEIEDWQEEHPTHESDMNFAREFLKIIVRRLGIEYFHVEVDWNKRAYEVRRKLKAMVKFYTRNQFLTKLRTDQFYGKGGVLETARAMDAELAKAQKIIGKRREYWRALMDHPGYKMLPWQYQNPISYAHDRAIDPKTREYLGAHYSAQASEAIAILAKIGPVPEP